VFVLVVADAEGEGVGVGAGADAGDEAAVVDAVEGGVVGAEVCDPEAGVVAADDGAGGVGTDDVCAGDFVGPGGDFGDAVGVEVGGEDLALIGLEGEMGGGFADVEEGQELVVLHSGVLPAAPGVGRGGQPDVHDLMAAGTGDEGFGAGGGLGGVVGGDGDVGGAGAAAEGCAELQGLFV